MSPSSYDSFIHALYGCCANPAGWTGLLDQLRTEMEVRSVVVQRLRIQDDRLRTVWSVQDSLTNDFDYRAAISDQGNPRLECRRLPRRMSRTGHLSSDAALFSRDEQPVRARFQDQLSRIGLGNYLGGVVELPDGQVLALALHRSCHDPREYSAAQQERVLALLPHLSQAMALLDVTQRRHSLEHVWRDQLERWPCMLLVCDRQGRLHWGNQRARACWPGALGQQSLRDVLCLDRSADLQRLMGLVQRANLQPSYMACQMGGQSCHVKVQLCPPSDDALDGERVELVGLSMSVDLLDETVSPEALMSLFGLTQAEGRLLSSLVAGESLQEYAQRRGISVGTVRQQLKHVFAKTGATRQADLVRRVLRSVGALACVDAPAPGLRALVR